MLRFYSCISILWIFAAMKKIIYQFLIIFTPSFSKLMFRVTWYIFCRELNICRNYCYVLLLKSSTRMYTVESYLKYIFMWNLNMYSFLS